MSAGIVFTKMHGLGNDFVMINNIDQKIKFTPKLILAISDRHVGIGCDQVLVIEKPEKIEKDIDFVYRIFNSDGSEVGQCGNGARCLAKYIHDKKLSTKKQLRVKTSTSILELEYHSDDKITVNMGIPQSINDIQAKAHEGTQLSLGNPHAVFRVESVDNPHFDNLGLHNFNVGFMEINDKQHIKLRVFERGVGETQACGSGACAAVVAGILEKRLDATVVVELLGGKLTIQWAGEGSPVMMTGAAVTVFEGHLL